MFLTVFTLLGSSRPPPEGAGKLTLLGLSWWAWVAIGVGSLIVIVLMVVVIFTVVRIKRKKVNVSAVYYRTDKEVV